MICPTRTSAIIGAPLDLGQGRRGVDMGPSAVRVANLNARLASLGYVVEDLGNVPVEQAEASPEGHPRAKYLPQIAATCQRLATARGADARARQPPAGAGRRPLGRGRHGQRRLALLPRARRRTVGLIWLDAHADMNTPETQPERQRPRHAAGLHRGRWARRS